jgi:hypothetical protein
MDFHLPDAEYVALWARAFCLTQVMEVPIYTAIAWKRAPAWRLALAAFACTAITHPLLWFVWPFVVRDYTAYVISGELLIAAAETLIFFALIPKLTLPRAIAAAFLANAVSYGVGQLLHALGLFS